MILLLPAQAITSIAEKISCSGHALLDCVKKAEVNSGARGGGSELADRLETMERENRELRQANGIPAQGFRIFAQAELDRPFKR